MKLKNYREAIDQIDDEIIELIDQRLELVKKIGTYKKENKLTILDGKRENEILEKIKTMNVENSEKIIEIYQQIMNTSKEIQ